MLKKTALSFLLLSITFLSSFAADRINGAGASFSAPLYYEWAYEYQKETRNRINFQSIGSGGGIKQVTNRIVDFGASDKPLHSKKLAKDALLQFPAIIGSVIVVQNVPGIADEVLRLKNSVVADIFAGRITTWNDPKIVADNPGITLPDEKIIVVHRSDGSGTTYNFTHFLKASSTYWKENFGTGKAIDWATGIGGKGNEGVSNLVKQTPYSIGYVEYAYKKQNKLAGATLQGANGKWVAAQEANFQAAATNLTWTKESDFNLMLTLQPGENAYPIVAASFILLPIEKHGINKKVVAFFEYAFKKGDAAARKLGYIPLPPETKTMISDYWRSHIK